jgi:hypothetical protein
MSLPPPGAVMPSDSSLPQPGTMLAGFNMSSLIAMYNPANQCAAQWSSIMVALGSGAMAPTPYSVYSAMVDLYLSGGDMQQGPPTPQGCNPATDTCCRGGIKPSTPEVRQNICQVHCSCHAGVTLTRLHTPVITHGAPVLSTSNHKHSSHRACTLLSTLQHPTDP